MVSLGRCYYALGRTRVGHRAMRFGVAAARGMGLLRGFHPPLDALNLGHDAVAPLMRLWSRIHWSCGDGMMPPPQMLAIYRLAATWPVRGEIVELGSWVGLTTCYLAAACTVHGDGKVHAVDTFEGIKEGGKRYQSVDRYGGSTLSAFQNQIQRAGLTDLVETHIGYTTQVAASYQGGPIRMMLIDADHSYEGVRADFHSWCPHVAAGGLVVFHDYLMSGVARFVDEVIGGDPRFDASPGLVEDNVMAITKQLA